MNARHNGTALVERIRWFGFGASVTGATVAGILAFSASPPPSTNAFSDRSAASVAGTQHDDVATGRRTHSRSTSPVAARRQAAARRHGGPGRTRGTGTEDRQEASPRRGAPGTSRADAGGGRGQHP